MSRTVTESREVTFEEDPAPEPVFDVTPAAESLLQLPASTPSKAPSIFRRIYESDSSSSNDDDEDIFLTPDLDNIDLNVLPPLVDDSDLFGTPLSQASQPGSSTPAPSPRTRIQSSSVPTPSHSTRARIQPSPVSTPPVHTQRTSTTARPATTAQSPAQCTPSPARPLTTTSVPTQRMVTPSAPSHTAVPIAPFKKRAVALTVGMCNISQPSAPTKTTTQSSARSNVSGGTLPPQPTRTSSRIKKKNTNLLDGDTWVVDDPHHHATVVQGPDTLEVSVTPNTYAQAMASLEAHQWQAAMKEEFNSLMRNGTYTLVPLPPGRNII